MDEVGVRVLRYSEHELIGFVTQEGHSETSSRFGEEAKSGKRCPRDTPSISDTVLRDVGAHGYTRLHAYRASAGR